MSESRKIRYLPPRWTWRFFPEERQRLFVLKSFREQMLFFHYDLSAVSDEEIEFRVREAARLIARAMPTVREVTLAFKRMAEAAGRVGESRKVIPGPGGGSTVGR